ncbi:MAG: GyrI-like domain-containing protein [Ignavibacteria bacterium]|nr:GyrI-like domain-containing protein [Ignavibacteria bacterium]
MQKVDLKKQYKTLFSGREGVFNEVIVPPLLYLMIDGEGNPNDEKLFGAKLEQLYSVAYTIKFMYSKDKGTHDYSVPALEGLWWCEKMEDFSLDNKNDWKWTLMIMQPDFISPADVEEACAKLLAKKKFNFRPQVRLEKLEEGQCVQVLYRGPYSGEAETIAQLHSCILGKGCNLTGKHHEIYLNDPRRVAAENLKTIIRQPYSE